MTDEADDVAVLPEAGAGGDLAETLLDGEFSRVGCGGQPLVGVEQQLRGPTQALGVHRGPQEDMGVEEEPHASNRACTSAGNSASKSSATRTRSRSKPSCGARRRGPTS